MLRFLSFLFGKPFEPCKSCETLKEQISYYRDENKRLTDTLLSIVKPKEVEAAPVEINPVGQSSALFSRRRAALEAKDREEAAIIARRQHIALPDNPRMTGKITNITTVDELEKELGIDEKEAN